MCSPQKDLFVVNGQFHLNNVMSLANESCFVIYIDYLTLSFSSEILACLLREVLIIFLCNTLLL